MGDEYFLNMGVKISQDNNISHAVINGDIDHHTAYNLRETIDNYIKLYTPQILKLDFSEVQFMDSSGIGLIMGRFKLIKSLGGNLKVINIPKNLERMMKLAGLEKLGIFESEDKISCKN